MADLLDANVWLALSVPDHQHYRRAQVYWKSEADATVLGCRATAQALLRLLTNPLAVGRGALHGGAAWGVLEDWRAAGLRMAEEPEGLEELLRAWAGPLDWRGGHWSDAYLAAFAVAGGYRLVTFDRDFGRYPQLVWLRLLR